MSQICRTGYLLTEIFAAALIVSIVWKPAPAAAFHKIANDQVPMRIGTFVGRDMPLDEGTREALYSAQVINRTYTSPVDGTVAFALIGGADRDTLHDPRSCITGAGGRIDNDRTELLPGTRVAVHSCDAVFTGASGEDESTIGDTIYFYVTKDGIVSDATKIRAHLLLTAFEQKGEPIFFVHCMVPVSSSTPQQMRQIEHKRLLSFTAQMWQRIAPVLAEGVKS